MECLCTVDIRIDSDDVSDQFGQVKTAKRIYYCKECKKRIIPGEKLSVTTTTFEGNRKPHVHRMCMDCNSLVFHMFKDFYFERVLEDLSEHIENVDCGISESCISKLTPKAREFVCDEIEKCWERL